MLDFLTIEMIYLIIGFCFGALFGIIITILIYFFDDKSKKLYAFKLQNK